MRRTYEEAVKQRALRPVTAPPDPITFQQQRKELSGKEKEHKQMIENLLNAPSLFAEKMDIEAKVRLRSLSCKTSSLFRKRSRHWSSSRRRTWSTATTARVTSARRRRDMPTATRSTSAPLSTRIRTNHSAIARISMPVTTLTANSSTTSNRTSSWKVPKNELSTESVCRMLSGSTATCATSISRF